MDRHAIDWMAAYCLGGWNRLHRTKRLQRGPFQPEAAADGATEAAEAAATAALQAAGRAA